MCEICVGRETEATNLLLSVLTPEQARQCRDFGCFEVLVNGRVYLIHAGGSYNITRVIDGKPRWRYCAIPLADMPTGYSVLAQFLMLTTDEDRFLRIANVTPF